MSPVIGRRGWVRPLRYIWESGWKSLGGRIISTLASLAVPLFCVSLKMTDASGNSIAAWKVFWTIFGTSNQLLAALTLMTLSLWLRQSGKSWWFSLIPAFFMMFVTLESLALILIPFFKSIFLGRVIFDAVNFVSLLLFVLAVLLIFEASKTLFPARVRD